MALKVSIDIDVDNVVGPWRQIYRFFGSDEFNYVYMKDGKKLMKKLGSLGGNHQVFFRAHNQFTTGKGEHGLKWGSSNALTEDSKGNPVYDWSIIDQVYDTYLEAGVKPYVQFGFMPECLSVKPQPYRHSWTPTAPYHEIFTGWTQPPNDYAKWEALVYEWTVHCIERYGRDECLQWYWETWNEPDIGYWQGTEDEFYQLHISTAKAVRRALPSARVGGPETTGRGVEYLKGFLERCRRGMNTSGEAQGAELDFVSFHAKGKPEYIQQGDFVRMGISTQLTEIDTAFTTISSFPEFRDKPVIIGESDPEGAAAAQGPQLAYRNSTMYSSYTAASFARKHDLADRHDINFEGAITWAFEFEDQPYFAGFRILSSNNIDLPVLNIFRMFAKMNGQRLQTKSTHQISLDQILSEGVRAQADVGAIAARDGNVTFIMVWHYHDDNVEGESAMVTINVADARATGRAAKGDHFRVDKLHSNAYTKWLNLGSPASPTSQQLLDLESAASLANYTGSTKFVERDGKLSIDFELPRQGVSLLVLGDQSSAAA